MAIIACATLVTNISMSATRDMKKIVTIGSWTIGSIAVIVVIGLGIAVALGYVRIGLKQPNQVAQSPRTVTCDSQDIKAYNVFVTTFTTTTEEQATKVANMQAHVTSLKEKAGFTDDPTCVFIEYATAVAGNDSTAVQDKVNALEALSKQGHYPSNELLDISSLGSMRDRVEAMKNAGRSNSDPRGSG